MPIRELNLGFGDNRTTIVKTTCAAFREKLATFLDRVSDNREVILVKGRGRPNVAIIAVDELAELTKTTLLQRSSKSAGPLLKSSQKLERGGAKSRPIRNSTTR
jgi:prevent-host-death family protein